MISIAPEDEAAAWLLAESIRWPGAEQECPHCGARGRHYRLAPRTGGRVTSTGRRTHRRLWKCATCRRQFSVLVGSALARSRLPLPLWLHAIRLMCARPAGMTAEELSRELGITRSSASQLGRRVRQAVDLATPAAEHRRATNEKRIKPVGDYEETLRQLLRPMPTPSA